MNVVIIPHVCGPSPLFLFGNLRSTPRFRTLHLAAYLAVLLALTLGHECSEWSLMCCMHVAVVKVKVAAVFIVSLPMLVPRS